MHHHGLVGAAEFAVQRPGDLRVGHDLDLARFQKDDTLAVVLLFADLVQQGGRLGKRGLAHKQHFKIAVIQLDLVFVEAEQTCHGGGIGDCAEGKIAFDLPVVIFDLQMVGADVCPLAEHAVDDICRVTEQVLHALAGGIGGAGKRAEGGDIRIVAVIEQADVVALGLAVNDERRGLVDVGGDAQRIGQIVGGAGGHIADGDALRQNHHAVDRFVERAVAAAADHKIFSRGVLLHDLGGVAPALCGMYGKLKIVLGKLVDDIKRARARLGPPGAGIHDQKHFSFFALHEQDPLCGIYRYSTIIRHACQSAPVSPGRLRPVSSVSTKKIVLLYVF